MALNPNALTTTAQVKSYVGIETSDASKDTLIEWLINGVSEFISSITRRIFQKDTYTLKIDGNGGVELFLSQYPVNSITSITENEQIVPPTEYSFYKSGIVHRDAGWRAGVQNITVVFEAGWNLPGVISPIVRDLPFDIEMACVRLVAKVLERRLSEGTTNTSSGGASTNWQKDMDSDIENTINLYKKINV